MTSFAEKRCGSSLSSWLIVDTLPISNLFYVCYLGEFVKNKTHRFKCFSTNDVIIERVYSIASNVEGILGVWELTANKDLCLGRDGRELCSAILFKLSVEGWRLGIENWDELKDAESRHLAMSSSMILSMCSMIVLDGRDTFWVRPLRLLSKKRKAFESKIQH